MQNQKSPVKIKRYSLSTKYGREDVVINKNTTITTTTADFKYQTQEDVTSIHSLANVAPEQLVKVKGYLAYLGGTKKILVQGSELKKQEGYIADPSGYIKIILWANHTDKLNQGSTYFFNKLRLKKNADQRYLNTPKQESECTIEEAEPFKDSLPTVDEVSTSKEITARILGISSINKYSSCCHCMKKVTIKGKVAFCNNCKMSQKSNTCKIQWSLRLYVENQEQGKTKVNLSVYGQQIVSKLFALSGLHEEATEDEVLEKLLDIDIAKLSYDTQSYKLIDIDPIKI